MAQALTERFGVPPENNLAEQLESIAAQLVSEYWVEHKRTFSTSLTGAFWKAMMNLTSECSSEMPQRSALPTLCCPGVDWSRKAKVEILDHEERKLATLAYRWMNLHRFFGECM